MKELNPMANLKFLVVDDDLFYQTYLRDLLAKFGVEVIIAEDGEDGLAMALEDRPDLIITGIDIPGTHGFVLFKKVRENTETRDIPFIMVSGKGEKGILEKHSQLAVHAEGYLVKPFTGQALIEAIRGVLGSEFQLPDQVPAGDTGSPESGRVVPGEDGLPDPSQYPERVTAPAGAEGNLTVLVVDDSPYILGITTEILEEIGARVETAPDGESGYKMASTLLPDLILLDVQMPKLNGFVVCEMLRKQEETRNIPIIIMSAVIDEDSFRKYSRLTYHADAYMQKPFMKSELLQIVGRFSPGKEGLSRSVESKAGYLVPTEEMQDLDSTVPRRTQDHFEEMERIKAELRMAASREESLNRDLETDRGEKDRLERELYSLRKSAQDVENALKDKLTLLTQRLDEARATAEKLAGENRSLKSRVQEETTLHDGSLDQETELDKIRVNLDSLERENEGLRARIRENGSASEVDERVKELAEKLEEAGSKTVELENRNELLERELENLRATRSLDSAPVEEEDKQGLYDEINALKRDLEAAVTAKGEIEDQAKMLVEGRDQEGALLKGNLAKAHESIEVLKRENEELTVSVGELDACRSRNTELERINEELTGAREEEGKREDQEGRIRKDLEAKLAKLSEENTILEDQASNAMQRSDELESQGRRIGELEERLKMEKELRALSEKEVGALNEQLQASRDKSEDFQKLEQENRQLREALHSRQKSGGDAQEDITGSATRPAVENVVARDLEERLSLLEDALSKTVVEAQNILREQQEKESTLEGNIVSLMRSLEEERSMYRKEREEWTAREGDLKDAFEDVIRENRRFASERSDRFYPIHIPSRNRPLKVVNRKSRYVYAAAVVIIFLLAAGYFGASMVRSRSGKAAVPVQSHLENADHQSSRIGAFSEAFIPQKGTKGSYEELWRRDTVQSVSDDMMIQATFHTHKELVAAIKYTAEKEGWTGERTLNTLTEMEKTYNLSNFYYVTIYSKNLKSGYPGYAKDFESHMVLRDQTGREVKGQVPSDLQKSRFITSRVSSPGKEMNPDFLYEVGLTLAFPREGLIADPESLQLVLYDIGALPERVLTWNMSRMETQGIAIPSRMGDDG